MSEKPIIFNTDMVKTILNGRKTQTRRLVKPRYRVDECGFYVCTNKATGERWIEKYDDNELGFENPRYIHPPYQPGDILWVRETWCHLYNLDNDDQCVWGTGKYYYAADTSI